MNETLDGLIATSSHFLTTTIPEVVASNPYIGISAALPVVLVATALLWRGRSKARRAEARANGEIHDLRSQLDQFETRFSPILDLERAIASRKQAVQVLDGHVATLRADYAHKRRIFDGLTHEISSLEGRIEYAELGIYEPDFQYDTSAEYAAALIRNKDQQKYMASMGEAATCSTAWSVNGSKRDGQTMANRAIRAALRAFNNECEVIISKVTWKNYTASRERIEKSATAIDKLNTSNAVSISRKYVQLKLAELRLAHEESLRKREEQEKLREERAAAREEEKAQRELETEIRRAEKAEREHQMALVRARAELAAATGAQIDRLTRRVAELEAMVVQDHQDKERAISMAQQTRVGNVYFISNIGSFGERVFKIGMTRRVDPMERVIELGDASVPFPFDVHAMIFTEDAPGLENRLHQALEPYRVNRINRRKEFFRISSAEVKAILAEKFPGLPFKEQPDAEQYFNSLPKNEVDQMSQAQKAEQFPVRL
jgi:hypothetical protein